MDRAVFGCLVVGLVWWLVRGAGGGIPSKGSLSMDRCKAEAVLLSFASMVGVGLE